MRGPTPHSRGDEGRPVLTDPSPLPTAGERADLTVIEAALGEISHRTVGVASIGVFGGVPHLTSSDLVIYTGHPLLDLRNGKVRTVWVTTNDPNHRLRPWDLQRDDRNLVHPRTFDLPRLGTKTLPEGIEAFYRPDSSISVFQDGEGHWWTGTLNYNHRGGGRVGFRPYVFEDPSAGQHLDQRLKLGYVYPWVDYLGPKPLWSETWRQDNPVHIELTFCTREVAKAINDTGMWHYYHPEGKARSDPERAKREALKIKAEMVEINEMREELKALRSEVAKVRESETRTLNEATQIRNDHSALKKEHQELQAAHEALKTEMATIRRQASTRYQSFDPLWGNDPAK